MNLIEIPLSEIQLDERAQPRCELDPSIIEEYAEHMKAGATLAPIDVFKGPEGTILADGYHRFRAGQVAELSHLPATVHEGGRRDAILFGVGANATHGLRRTSADKRRAVLTLLHDPEWRQGPTARSLTNVASLVRWSQKCEPSEKATPLILQNCRIPKGP